MESIKVQITQKTGKERRGNSYRTNEKISRQKAHTNTQKLNLNILVITDVFLNQKRVNVCEHMVKTVPCELQVSATRMCLR